MTSSLSLPSPAAGKTEIKAKVKDENEETTLQASPSREFCFPQVFNATCPQDHVIVVQVARYGRMKHGRCITSDYHIGCSADVLAAVDQRCSGRQHCVIAVPDTELHDLQPCPKDLFAYLEAGYICVKGK